MVIRARKTALVLAVAAILVAVVAPAGANPRGLTPRAPLVSANFLTVRASVGSFCTFSRPKPGGSAGECADYVYPLPVRGHLPVSPGDKIRLRLRHNTRIRDRVVALHLSLVRVSGHDYKRVGAIAAPTQNPDHHSRWTARLPASLHGANVLDISARYPQGDADFWAGLSAGG